MPDGAAPMMPTSQPIGSATVQPAPATEMPMPEDADMPLITTMMPDGAAPMMPTSQPIGSATVQPAGPTCSSLSSASASSFSGQNVAARDLGSVPFGSSSKDSHCSSS